jgi:ketosteroid isomerase-like protein
MESWQVIARESIRDIVARYNSNGDSGRIDAMMDLFTPDAVLEVDGSEILAGRDSIRRFFSTVAETRHNAFELKSLHHHTSTHQIDILDKKTATGRCYFQVLTHQGLDHWGRYIDEYRRIDQQWKIQSRKVFVDGVTPGGWGEAQGH